MNVGNERNIQLKPWHMLLMGFIFFAAGIGLSIYSVITIRNYNEKNMTYKEISATVVDYAYDSDGLEAIIVEYDVNGRIYRMQSNTYSNMPKSIGTIVQVKYNPNNPLDAIWVNDSSNIIMPIVGGLFTVAGIILVIIGIKKNFY